VRRELHAVLLLLVGGTLLKISITGSYVRYVKVGTRPLLIAAGIVLVVIAVATLWRALSVRRVAGESGHDDGHGHGHGDGDDGHGVGDDGHGHGDGDDGHGHAHGRLDVAWLLVLPALALLLIAPPALGSYAAARSGTALGAAQTSDFPPLPDGDPVRVSVLDYASRAVFDHGRSLGDRHVTLSGFLIAAPDGGWYLARMVITCCAADARPIKVGLTGSLPGDLKADAWLEVTGSYTARTAKDSVNEENIPYLTVDSSRPVPAPVQQYES
jgi:uncharacterized repeat protein (TIGR03943 family)